MLETQQNAFHFSVLPSFEVILTPVSSFFYVDSPEFTVNIRATYVKVFVLWLLRSGFNSHLLLMLNFGDHIFNGPIWLLCGFQNYLLVSGICLVKRCMAQHTWYLGFCMTGKRRAFPTLSREWWWAHSYILAVFLSVSLPVCGSFCLQNRHDSKMTNV